MRFIQDPNNPRRRIEVQDDPQSRATSPISSNYSDSSCSSETPKIVLYVIFTIIIIIGAGICFSFMWFNWYSGEYGVIFVYVLALIAIIAVNIPIAVHLYNDNTYFSNWGEFWIVFFKMFGSVLAATAGILLTGVAVRWVVAWLFG